MKSFIVVLLVVLFSQCSGPRIYIVRHAEKETVSQDPDLTAEGKARAEDLAAVMKNNKIEKIYSTETNRTKQTAAPFSAQSGIHIEPYRNDTLQKFLYHILESGKNTLIIGHSNTSLTMLRELSLTPSMNEIPEDDYDNLFIVTLKSRSGPAGFRLKLKESTYGKKSPAPEKAR